MKKLLSIASAALLLSGCSSMLNYPRQTTTTFLDFRPYTSSGFFFSADPYPEKYSPVGQLLIEIIPGRSVRGVEIPDSDELLKTAYEEAVSRGADGISNFSIKVDDTYTSVANEAGPAGKFTDAAYPQKKATFVQTKRIIMSGTLIKTGK